MINPLASVYFEVGNFASDCIVIFDANWNMGDNKITLWDFDANRIFVEAKIGSTLGLNF